MNIRAARWLTATSVALVAMACHPDPAATECAAPDTSTPVQALAIAVTSDAPTYSDKSVTLTLVVSADIPCLSGGTVAAMSTSTGTIGGNAPDKPFSLYLAPTGDAGSTHLEGFVELVIPYGRTARADAVIGEASATANFGPYISDAGAGGAGGAGGAVSGP
jgi:hypothetical protein